eukprot:CAMPEP_0171459514 /NCGR_PEP_ID=MMETSP0945-20130129/4769_1 /TAXON_ID=109269 /ORGANISM="Vaucheria litorea, Strain CCMP2940" /LENGTH=189 /DNA_ID=CAMNT_0011985551 /DNA_START=52 /DNA_END=621 /DNA_ORIENTATION=-
MEPSWVKAEPQAAESGDLSQKLVEEGMQSTKSKKSKREAKGNHFSKTLFFFQCFTIFIIIMSLAAIAANGLTIYEYTKEKDIQYRSIILRVYAISFAVMIILTEIDWRGFMRYFIFLDNWVSRGISYCFVGLITWDQDATYSTVEGAINQTVSFILIGCGVFYAVLGIACMKTVKETELRSVADTQVED